MTIDQPSTVAEAVRRYMICVYQPDDIIEVRRLPSGRSTWHKAEELADVAPELLADNQAGQHIYIGANPRTLNGGKKNDDVACGRCLFADFDNINIDVARSRWHEEGLPEPTLVVASGHGVHAYWRLTEAVTDMLAWKETQRQLIAIVDSDKAIHDPARIMRLPGFVNHKEPAAPCEILEAVPDRTYRLSDLATCLKELPECDPQENNAPGASPPPGSKRVEQGGSLRDLGRATLAAAEWPGVSEGKRNSEAFRHAADLVKDFGLSQDHAWDILAQWNAKNTPPLPQKELRTCLDNGACHGKHPVGLKADSWPDPQPIPDGLPHVKAFDARLLPETFRNWCMDIAERMQCPPDFPAVSAMVAFGAVVGRRIGIRPKKCDDWLVIPNLWGAIIGRPSSMKSPPLKEAIKPLRRLIAQADEEYEADVREATKDSRRAKLCKSVLESDIKRLMRAGEDCDEQLEELQALEDSSQPKHRRYMTSDTSAEALAELMAANPNGILACRDELIGLLKYLEREGQESSRAFFIEGWDGNGSYAQDRIGRGLTVIRGVCLSLLGTIQPGVLAQYLTAAVCGGVGDDGLMQRFQLAVWPDSPGVWKNIDRSPDTLARDRAFEVFQRIDQADGISLGGEPDIYDSNGVPLLHFDGTAQERFYEWMHRRENYLRGDTEHAAIESHLTKYRSLIPSLALLIHLADGHSGSVGLGPLESAIGWGNYLESHARRIYSVAIRRAEAAARALAEHLIRGDLPKIFSARTIQRKGWSGLTENETVREAIDVLEDLDWLAGNVRKTGGRTATEYAANPRIPGNLSEKALTEPTKGACVSFVSTPRNGPGRKPSPKYEIKGQSDTSGCAEDGWEDI